MKTFLNKLLNALFLLLAAGGLVCAIVLAIKAKAWVPLVAILVLGGMAAPTAKKCVKNLSDSE